MGCKINYLIYKKFLGDGIYDKLETSELLEMVWDFKTKGNSIDDIHEYTGKIVDGIMKQSLKKMTSDNITIIFISFNNFKEKMEDCNFNYEFSGITSHLMENEIDLSEKSLL
jgi:serine/threonine protein phosphatase PrpC